MKKLQLKLIMALAVNRAKFSQEAQSVKQLRINMFQQSQVHLSLSMVFTTLKLNFIQAERTTSLQKFSLVFVMGKRVRP
jgi:hypothetical protein